MYRQVLEGHDLSIEQGTTAVPDDDCFYVIFNGEVVGRYRSLNKAVERFRELKKTLNWKPVESPKPSLEELRRRDMESMSNKALIWTEEDFARVQRKTQGKKGTRSAG